MLVVFDLVSQKHSVAEHDERRIDGYSLFFDRRDELQRFRITQVDIRPGLTARDDEVDDRPRCVPGSRCRRRRLPGPSIGRDVR